MAVTLMHLAVLLARGAKLRLPTDAERRAAQRQAMRDWAQRFEAYKAERRGR